MLRQMLESFLRPSDPAAKERAKVPPKAAPAAPSPVTDWRSDYNHEARLGDQLRLHEGERERAYRDTEGNLTIGIGRNLDAKGLSRDEREYLLANDIADARRELDRYLPWWRGLDPIRQRVLIDMMFNMGPGAPDRGGLLSFVNTLSEIRRGNYAIAADMMLASKWASQVGRRAVRLATMMRTGMDYTE